MIIQQKLWLIGGTSDSVSLARAIAAQGWPVIVTVTTPEAVNLYQQIEGLSIQVGQLDQRAIAVFLKQENIIGIIDASHPFAIVISQNAIELAERLQIPYLRYERTLSELSQYSERVVKKEPTETIFSPSYPHSVSVSKKVPEERQFHSSSIINLDSLDILLRGNYLKNQRVLLTIGAKNLERFQAWQEKSTLFARVLPRLPSLQLALEAGFTSDRIIALRPPYSLELEKALWQQWSINLVVTKASGEAGGEVLKQELCQQLGISLIRIARPPMIYPQQTDCLQTVLEFVTGLMS